MPATECQSRTLSEVLQLLDGVLVFSPVDACRQPPAYDVRVEHVIRMDVVLCEEHELMVQAGSDETGWISSLRLRPPS